MGGSRLVRMAKEGEEERIVTTAAWIMLICTWAVIIGFTLYFFIKVLRTPQRDEDEERNVAFGWDNVMTTS